MKSKLLVLIIGCAAALLADPVNKLSKDLPQRGAGMVQVIVQFQQGLQSTETAMAAAQGGVARQAFPTMRAAALTLPIDSLAQRAADPNVRYISLDRQIAGGMSIAASTVGADLAASYGWDGPGIGLAVIDSGINDHPDLGGSAHSRVVYSESFVANPADNSGRDQYGHGTHVAGIIAAAGTYHGISPGVRLVDLRALDANGVGSDSSVIHALEPAVELKDIHGIRVVNLSLGRPVFESYHDDPLCQAVETAWHSGITVVVAAGSYGRFGFSGSGGYWTITAPGNDPLVLTVGAMRSMGIPDRADDLIASYRSKGPSLFDAVVKPDLVAPGSSVTSLLASRSCTLARELPAAIVSASNGNTAQYLQLSGTSMAAAVASAAALLLEKEPMLTPGQIKIRLMKTSSKTFPASSAVIDSATGIAYQSQYEIFTIGAGYLDVLAALTDASHPAGRALSPFAAFNPANSAVTIVADPSSSFATGLPAVWGTHVFESTSASIVWGSAVGATSLAWGSSAAWGRSGPPVGEGL